MDRMKTRTVHIECECGTTCIMTVFGDHDPQVEVEKFQKGQNAIRKNPHARRLKVKSWKLAE